MKIFGIVLNSGDLWFLGIGGACLVWLIPHRLAIARDRRAAFLVAGHKLRAAFSQALGQISAAGRHREGDPDQPDVLVFLKEAFGGHAAAVEEFRPFVRSRRQRAFEKAWQDYRDLAPMLWAGAESNVSDQENRLRAIEERIRAILAFAD